MALRTKIAKPATIHGVIQVKTNRCLGDFADTSSSSSHFLGNSSFFVAFLAFVSHGRCRLMSRLEICSPEGSKNLLMWSFCLCGPTPLGTSHEHRCDARNPCRGFRCPATVEVRRPFRVGKMGGFHSHGGNPKIDGSLDESPKNLMIV